MSDLYLRHAFNCLFMRSYKFVLSKKDDKSKTFWGVWIPSTSPKKSPPSLPWAMFSKVDSLRRSKQEWMPRPDCKERQINETAHQFMRSSFVKIVVCGQFCFGDLKSVFMGYICVHVCGCVCRGKGGLELLICTGSLAHDACRGMVLCDFERLKDTKE